MQIKNSQLTQSLGSGLTNALNKITELEKQIDETINSLDALNIELIETKRNLTNKENGLRQAEFSRYRATEERDSKNKNLHTIQAILVSTKSSLMTVTGERDVTRRDLITRTNELLTKINELSDAY